MTDHGDEVRVPGSPATRRAVLFGAGALGAGALGATGLLAACSSEGDNGSSTSTKGRTSAARTPEVMKTSDVPVGGGVVYQNANVVVTQPTAGEFKAFDATCTHLGCQVGAVRDGTIQCPCHLSMFNITDGSVARGPATRGLATKKVAVSGDTITVS